MFQTGYERLLTCCKIPKQECRFDFIKKQTCSNETAEYQDARKIKKSVVLKLLNEEKNTSAKNNAKTEKEENSKNSKFFVR